MSVQELYNAITDLHGSHLRGHQVHVISYKGVPITGPHLSSSRLGDEMRVVNSPLIKIKKVHKTCSSCSSQQERVQVFYKGTGYRTEML